MSSRFDQLVQSVKFEIDYCWQNDVLPFFQIISVSMNDTTLLLITLQEDHSILPFSRRSENSDNGITMVVYEKIYLEAQINNPPLKWDDT